MQESVLRTEDLPPDDRFDCWYQMTRSSILSAIVSTARPAEFQASTRVLNLGHLHVHQLVVPEVQVSRPWKLVRQSDAEDCHLTLVVRGRLGFTQAGRSTTAETGDILFYDSSHPFTGWSSHNEKIVESGIHVGIRFPRAEFPYPAIIDRFIGTSLPNRGGIRGLLAAYMRELITVSAERRETAFALSGVTVDLVAALLTHAVDQADSLPPDARQRALLAQIRHFIDLHLSSPALSPATIAAAHHISVRYLHKLFHTQEQTVAGWIRRRRLERCHLDLADARQHARPIHAIAARWGFTDNAHFSRLFRATYGISASDYRQSAMRGHETAQSAVHASSTEVP